MKITIVLGAFLPVPPIMGGAIEKVWCALSAVFAQEGHEVLVISRALPHLPISEKIGGVQHRRVNERLADGGRRTAAELSLTKVAARFLQEFEKLRVTDDAARNPSSHK